MVINIRNNERVFIDSYFEAVRFTEDNQKSLFCEEWEREQIIECLCFLASSDYFIRQISDDNYSQAGHDFWLSRNGHGTGFFDREDIYGKNNSQWLQSKAEKFGVTTGDFEEC